MDAEECCSDSDEGNEATAELSGRCENAGSSSDDDGCALESQEQLQQRREENIKALVSGSLDLRRKALLPKVLNVIGAEQVLRSAFKSPFPNAPAQSNALRRRLLKRRVFVPWGSSTPFKVTLPQTPQLPDPPAPAPQQEEEEDTGEPLVLWEPSSGEGSPVAVDSMLTKWLRPHQREGVAFMFECVAGLRQYEGQGCILADDMGLGKTLQGITLLWTLLQSGHEELGGTPMAKRIIICCPTSLVSNWDSECTKWLKGRVRTLPLSESSREDVISTVKDFLNPKAYYQVLILSYETFRLHEERFRGDNVCDLLICDEAHRLKNDQTLTNKALDNLQCKRRVLLSGTPMQNHLDEFYAMVNFCNPGVLGTPAHFRRNYEAPIVASREPDATDAEVQRGTEQSNELSAIVNNFILRRTNALLSAHLPPKVVEVVCCRPSQLQRDLYEHFLRSNAAQRLLSSAAAGKGKASALTAINALRKLCGHPKLIYDVLHPAAGKAPAEADGFKNCGQFFPPGLFDDGRPGRGRGVMPTGWHLMSGKMAVLACMLEKLRPMGDRIVVVSNSTQVLDLVGALCRERNYPVLRLDGTTTLKKRAKMVQQFNQEPGQFVFLLSSKAGGCGINLIGGNRLVLFDPDWNPANDKQAAARVWRDGQKKRVYVYRFLTTGTIEEKVFQRQLSKEGLQQVVNSNAASAEGEAGGGLSASAMSSDELRDLFTLRTLTLSDTYDSMCAADDSDVDVDGLEQGPARPEAICREQDGTPAEEDLQRWGQHSSTDTVPDRVMQSIGIELPEQVSFVFACKVAGKAVAGEEEDPALDRAASNRQASTSAPAATPPSLPTAHPAQHPLGAGHTPATAAASAPADTPAARPPISAPSRLTAASRRPRMPHKSPRAASTAPPIAASGKENAVEDPGGQPARATGIKPPGASPRSSQRPQAMSCGASTVVPSKSPLSRLGRAGQGVVEALTADGGPVLLEADSPKRQKAGSSPTVAVRSWAAAEDTSESDFE